VVAAEVVDHRHRGSRRAEGRLGRAARTPPRIEEARAAGEQFLDVARQRVGDQ